MKDKQSKIILTVLALGVSFALSAPAAARDENAPPAVEVYTDSLDQLSPANATRAGYARPVMAKPDGSIVALPQTTHKIVPLSADAPPVSKPFAVRRTESIAPIQPRQPQNFPVKVRKRDESFDPGAPVSRQMTTEVPPDLLSPHAAPTPQIAVQKPAAAEPSKTAKDTNRASDKASVTAKAPKQDQGATPPLPGRKPSAEALLASDAPPLPKRRPSSAQASAQNPAGLPPAKIAAPTPPGRRSAVLDAGVLRNAPKVMPAVPANPVGVEVLAAPAGIPVADNNDPLLVQLQDFNRDNFIKSVENVTKGIAPVPAKKPQRGGMPPPLARDNRAIVTPNAGQIAAQAAATHAVKEDKLVDVTSLTPQQAAAMNPAAGGEKFAARPIDKTPRMPPRAQNAENAFLSVPFMPGDEKASPDILARLDNEVLPLLQKNPNWRIQIQAFSSPDNDIRSSARRTALSRALSVREYLISKGIEAPRMDIRALGMETDRDPLDRIDLVFFDQESAS